MEYFNIENENPEPIVQKQAKFNPKDILETRLIIGLIFITIAILSRVFNFYAGGILRLPLFLSGILLITKGIKKDFLSIESPSSYSNIEEEKGLMDKRSFIFFRYISYFSKNEGNQYKIISNLNLCDVYDYLIIVILPAMMILNLLSIIILTPLSFSGFYYKILIHILFSGIIFYLLWRMYLKPQRFLKISTNYENFFFRLQDNKQHPLKIQNFKRKIIFRLSVSVVFSILSIIFYLTSIY